MKRFYSTSLAFLPILIPSFFQSEKHSFMAGFVVLTIGDIFSCHAVDNPDFESEMVSSTLKFSLQMSHNSFNYG